MNLSRIFPVFFACCLSLTAIAQEIDDASGRALEQGTISIALIEAQRSELQSSDALDDAKKTQLLDLYDQAIANLDARKTFLRARDNLVARGAAAPGLISELEREIGRLVRPESGAEAELPAGIDNSSSTAAVAQVYLQVQAKVEAAQADLESWRVKSEIEQQRLFELRKQWAGVRNRLLAAVGAADASPLSESDPSLREAQQWVAQTAELALSAESAMLEQELLTHPVRQLLVDTQLALSERLQGNLVRRQAAIEQLLGERRQAEADAAIASAQRARLETAGRHPLLIEVATENTEISRELLTLGEAIDRENANVQQAEAQVVKLEAAYRELREKLDAVGMSQALGRILYEQRNSLPRQRSLRAALKSKSALLSEIRLNQLVIQEQLKVLEAPEALAEELLSGVVVQPPPGAGDAAEGDPGVARSGDELSPGTGEPEAERPDTAQMSAVLIELLWQRRDLLNSIVELNSTYLQILSDLEFAQRQLVSVVGEYDSYLSERLLWVPSVARSSVDAFFVFQGDMIQLVSKHELREMLRSLLAIDAYTPLLLLGVLGSAWMLYRRPALLQSLVEANRFLGNPVSDHFGHTLQSLVITLLLSSPFPLLVASFGWKLAGANDPSALSLAFAAGLAWLSMNWFFFLVSFHICRPEGLAHRHFRWRLAAFKPLRREILLLMMAYLPLAFLTIVAFELDTAALEWAIVSVLLIASAVVFAVFFVRVLRINNGALPAPTAGRGNKLPGKRRWVWYGMALALPMALVVLIILGYVYTAAKLIDSLVMSFWLLVVLVVFHQCCVRGLRMTAAKLNYRALQDERKRQFEEMLAAQHGVVAGVDALEEPEVDLAVLGRDSMKLVNIFTVILAIFGLLAVGSDVLPALGYLDNIQLWDTTATVYGETVLTPVTLADVGAVLLILAIVYFLYGDLPSLLELFMLQVLQMNASNRYTVITLMRYSVIILGLTFISAILGVQWSELQWLVAALGLGIGFGLQEIVANFISGLIILFERPIRVGDRVTIGDVEGLVSRIRIRATTIQTWDRQELLVPNKDFITGTLLNWSLSDQISRLIIRVGVAYGTDVTEAMAVIAQVAENDEKVMSDPSPFVSFDGFGDNALNLSLRVYLDDMEVRVSTSSRLHQGINEAFVRAGIEMPFPQLDVHFDS